MMSGSGSTIFAVGSPDDAVADTWQGEISSAHDVEIFEENFCSRPADERLWYDEVQ